MPLQRLLSFATARARRLAAPVRYLSAFALAAAAYGAREGLSGLWGEGAYPYLVSLPAILGASLFGVGPGSLTLALSTLAAMTRLPPQGSLLVSAPEHWVAVALFVANGLGLAAIIESLARLLERARDREAELRTSEEGRRLALQEFRHRMRNDLQSLVSLLLLRARGAKGAESKAALKEAAQHALAFARVHRQLEAAHFEAGAGVCAGELVRDLTAELERVHMGDGLRPVAIVTAAEAHRIPTETAVHLGLVTNELVTNALKYGFPDERSGTVAVSFRAEGAELVLTVSDDGRGMGPAADVTPGQGTRLLRGLAAQLRGAFRRGAGPGGRGTVAEVRFPIGLPPVPAPVPGDSPAPPKLRSVA